MICGGQLVLLRMQPAISGKKGFIKSQGLWPELLRRGCSPSKIAVLAYFTAYFLFSFSFFLLLSAYSSFSCLHAYAAACLSLSLPLSLSPVDILPVAIGLFSTMAA